MSNTQQDLLKKKILEGLKGTNPSALVSNNIGSEISGMSDAIDKARLTPTASTTPTLEDILGSTGYGANKTASDDYMNQYKNHTFNFNANALYNQYAPQYQKQARLGMEDAIGRASALTGGYGSSYAQAVGQQAYYNQMDKLDDRILDLYNIAYGQYRDEKNDLLGMANYYNGLAQQDYDNALALIGKMGEGEKIDLSQVPKDLMEKLNNVKNNAQLAEVLNKYLSAGVISPEEADSLDQLYAFDESQYKNKDGTPNYLAMLKNPALWDYAYNGGKNGMGGIDRDAILRAPSGDEISAIDLLKYLRGVDANNPRQTVKQLLELLGIND